MRPRRSGVWIVALLLLPFFVHMPARPDAFATVAATGSGRVTLGITQMGRISMLQWPSPGYYAHFAAPTSWAEPDVPIDGLLWGLGLDGQTYWLDEAPWVPAGGSTQGYDAALTTILHWPAMGVTARQTVAVHPEHDVVAIQITFEGLDDSPTLFWNAQLSPATRLIPELPIQGIRTRHADGFAVVTGADGTVFHFRPDAVDRRTFHRAEDMFANGATLEDWFRFGEGTWIAWRLDEPDTIIRCGIPGTASCVRTHPEGADTPHGILGDSNVVAACTPQREDEAFTAIVYLAVARTGPEARAALDNAMDAGFESLTTSARRRWEDRPPDLPEAATPEQVEAQQIAARILLQHGDPSTGAMARGPLNRSIGRLENLRDGPLTAVALDTIGLHDWARQRLDFLLAQVRREEHPGRPAGSLPAAVYLNGTEASPRMILDVEAGAWLLFAAAHHVAILDDTRRYATAEAFWPTIEEAARFLAYWRDPRTREPLPAFSPLKKRDAQSLEQMIHVRMGLVAAVQIAHEAGVEQPAWERRIGELDTLIGERLFTIEVEDLAHLDTLFSVTGALAAETTAWDDLVEAKLAVFPELEGSERLRVLNNLVWIIEEYPDTPGREHIPESIDATVAEWRNHPPQDAYEAALMLLLLRATSDET